MNTDSEGISGVNWVKQFLPPMGAALLCLVNSGGHSLRDRREGEMRYSAGNF